MAATAIFARRLGTALKDAGAKKGSGWFGPHMAAASQAILERIPMVDLTIEIRDSRIPFSSAYGDLDHLPSSSRHMIVLNKMDLADRSQTKKWVKHFEEQSCICYAVNSHNKDNIKEFLRFIQSRIREIKGNQSNYTATVMLVGIPNVGKSAIANSLHQIGRISAAEKGKLKHAVISPFPGETKDISSFKDFIVRDVRQALFKTISSFNGNLEIEKEMMGLIEAQFAVLHEAFRVLPESGEDGCRRVATKLLNLYRTGRLGHYTLDPVPRNFQ